MKQGRKLVVGLFGLAITGGFIACQSGDTDGGPAADEGFPNQVFVADESNTGSVRIVQSGGARLPVGEIAGFFVEVKRNDGAGLANVQVRCDTERGLALIDPTTGFELTNSEGVMSAKIGCSAPGSFQLLCSTSIGGNRRDFAEYICEGDIPEGFDGFSGAGGGGLGAGVLGATGTPASGIGGADGSNALRINKIDFYDEGVTTGDGTLSIDVVQGVCGDGASTPTPEKFFDTSVALTVQNRSNQTIRVNEVRYRVTDATASGGNFRSGALQVIGDIVVPAGGETRLIVLVFEADGGAKSFFQNQTISSSLGFRRVDFTVEGSSDLNEDTVATGGATVSFGNFNNCE
jgi:hypothetical protein